MLREPQRAAGVAGQQDALGDVGVGDEVDVAEAVTEP